MTKEIKGLKKNRTWKLVERPKDKKVIDVKWVFRKKAKNIYKARLVVRRFQQEDQIDNTYLPMVKMQTLEIVLSFCYKNGLFIEQMDVEAAFLNGETHF